ncbi:hypothetical protein Rhal01_02135 [Rubritalea halochordaticola]|uniref:Uncharacterized protein n=1 Tax=Rubritalea halochordaticola TaxID=714537 RepID=A0ABP9V214_9BACT
MNLSCYLLLTLAFFAKLQAGELKLVQPFDLLPSNFYEKPETTPWRKDTSVAYEPAVLIRGGSSVYQSGKSIDYKSSEALLAPISTAISLALRTQKANLTPDQQKTILARPGHRLISFILHASGETYIVSILYYGKDRYFASINTSSATIRYKGKTYYCTNEQDIDRDFPNNSIADQHLQGLLIAHPEVSKFAQYLFISGIAVLPDSNTRDLLPQLPR